MNKLEKGSVLINTTVSGRSRKYIIVILDIINLKTNEIKAYEITNTKGWPNKLNTFHLDFSCWKKHTKLDINTEMLRILYG